MGMKLPDEGRVIGVDVGYSTSRRSSAVACLSWDESRCDVVAACFRAIDEERDRAIRQIVGSGMVLAAAFDGPLRGDLEEIGVYREAERSLTVQGLREKIGKPGQASAPVGKALNRATNDCVKSVLKRCRVADARHSHAIHLKAVIEAFPSSFLGLMLEDPNEVPTVRANRSDAFFQYLAATGSLDRLLGRVLPERVAPDWAAFTNHDERAAVVCALTALCVAKKDYTAVGDSNGWIILPPIDLIGSWALPHLVESGDAFAVVIQAEPLDTNESATAPWNSREVEDDDWNDPTPLDYVTQSPKQAGSRESSPPAHGNQNFFAKLADMLFGRR